MYISETLLTDREGKIMELGDTVIVHPKWSGNGACVGTLIELGSDRSYIKFDHVGMIRGVPNSQIRRWEVEDRI